ncbi:MAG: aspartate kinase [Saprospiraceae bacterium]|nr:aspartate kinase [Saprospiraceae bacterium]
MKVFKFGGASIKDAASIQNVVQIIQQYQKDNPVVIISASGKMTNALEEVLEAYIAQNGEATKYLDIVRAHHQQLMDELFEDPNASIYAEINDLFVEIEWILEEEPQEHYDYIYDQLVSFGELFSTKIVAAYLQKQGLPATWLDVRDCIATDNTYRDAQVEWELTEQNIQKVVPALREKGLVVTQGFIGCTSENFTTTLGREGSDYTAAIFAYSLSAACMVIWKDVPGILTGDPRIFDKVEKLERISYQEAIEMTYYGAQVIHPKTLKPLQNRQIPLYVKSFIDPTGKGTIIDSAQIESYPPVLVVKKNQALLRIVAKDFHFVDEARFASLFQKFSAYRVKVNMTQNTALAFSVCVNNDLEKIEHFIQAIEEDYTIEKIDGLKLFTIRYGTQEMIDHYVKTSDFLLGERIWNNTQLVVDQNLKL